MASAISFLPPVTTAATKPTFLWRPSMAGQPLRITAVRIHPSGRTLGRDRGRSLLQAKAGLKYKGTQMREQHLAEMIEVKVKEATEVCEGNVESEECKVAWDEVEEVSQAKADLRRKMENADPLESYCKENPETDECRIYED